MFHKISVVYQDEMKNSACSSKMLKQVTEILNYSFTAKVHKKGNCATGKCHYLVGLLPVCHLKKCCCSGLFVNVKCTGRCPTFNE